jgi:DNA-directed RNA polymerase subunit RPC12/RpoP
MSGISGGGAQRVCPDCGGGLWDDGNEGVRYECHNDKCLGGRVFLVRNGELWDPSDPNRPAWNDDNRTCERCQSSLSGGDSSLPWSDGDNPHAYIICPSCGHKNVLYGAFGEDD